jgi:LAO/AO transport system kinase
MTLSSSLLSGDRLTLARLLTQVENDTPLGRQALDELFPHAGKAHRIGVTGAPGTGKSSLVNQLARYYRQPGDGAAPSKVAIVAVDPTSPFTGGALLGDRVRMRDLAGDPGVFIRSMASRGSLGGLAAATTGVVQVFDATGFDVILIETVGAGQAEVDIARLAHTTLVVEAPGLGDDIQAIKAGILEIADVLVVNKADQPGADVAVRILGNMLGWAHPPNAEHFWLPPIVSTVALDARGIPDLAAEITRHRQFLQQTGGWHERERFLLQAELETILHAALISRWRAGVSEEEYRQILTALVDRQISPHQAAERLLP